MASYYHAKAHHLHLMASSNRLQNPREIYKASLDSLNKAYEYKKDDLSILIRRALVATLNLKDLSLAEEPIQDLMNYAPNYAHSNRIFAKYYLLKSGHEVQVDQRQFYKQKALEHSYKNHQIHKYDTGVLLDLQEAALAIGDYQFAFKIEQSYKTLCREKLTTYSSLYNKRFKEMVQDGSILGPSFRRDLRKYRKATRFKLSIDFFSAVVLETRPDLQSIFFLDYNQLDLAFWQESNFLHREFQNLDGIASIQKILNLIHIESSEKYTRPKRTWENKKANAGSMLCLLSKVMELKGYFCFFDLKTNKFYMLKENPKDSFMVSLSSKSVQKVSKKQFVKELSLSVHLYKSPLDFLRKQQYLSNIMEGTNLSVSPSSHYSFLRARLPQNVKISFYQEPFISLSLK